MNVCVCGGVCFGTELFAAREIGERQTFLENTEKSTATNNSVLRRINVYVEKTHISIFVFLEGLHVVAEVPLLFCWSLFLFFFNALCLNVISNSN